MDTLPPLKIQAPVPGKNQYCGPATVSALTGVTGCEAARVMCSLSQRRFIKGCPVWLLRDTLFTFGISMFKMELPKGDGKHLTLKQWFKKTPRSQDQVYLILARHHWQLVQGNQYTCGQVQKVVSIYSDCVKDRAVVKGVWLLERTSAPRIEEVLKRQPKPLHTPLEAKCRSLAKKLDCTLEFDRDIDSGGSGLWWVYGPWHVYEYGDEDTGREPRPDPCKGSHAHCGWGEVWDALTTYRDDLEKVGVLS